LHDSGEDAADAGKLLGGEACGGLEAAAELAFTEVGCGGEAADGERAAGTDKGASGLDDVEVGWLRGEGADGAFEDGSGFFGGAGAGEGAIQAGCEGGETEGKRGDDAAEVGSVKAEKGAGDAGFQADAEEFVTGQDFGGEGIKGRTDKDDGAQAGGVDEADGAVGWGGVEERAGVGRDGKYPVAREPLLQVRGGRVLFITHRFQGTGVGQGAGRRVAGRRVGVSPGGMVT